MTRAGTAKRQNEGLDLPGEEVDEVPTRKRGRPRSSMTVVAPFDFQLPELMPTELTRELARGIVFGEHAPGTRFIEEDVAAAFKVSRSPVREAFRRLEADGLVVREARRGVRVTPISLADLDEVYSCRLELEGLAAEQAAHRGPEHREDLDRAFAKLREARDSGELTRYFDTNIAFTAAIHDLSGNATLIRLLQGLTKQALRYRFLAYKRFPDMMDFSLRTNQDIVDAVQRGHGTIAREVARLLVRHAWTKIRDAVH